MKKIILSILAISMICSMCGVSAENIVTDKTTLKKINTWDTPSNKYNKLHFYFMEDEYSTIDDADEMGEAFNKMNTASVFNMVDEASENIELDVTIQFDSDISSNDKYIELVNRRSELKTIDDVHEWRDELNSFSKDYHDELVEKNLSYLESLEYSDYKVIKYSPFVALKMDKSKIHINDFSNLIESDDISHISFDYEPTPVSEMSWDDVIDTINATSIIGNRQLTGKDVRIGILESGGICDDDHESLSEINITYNDFSNLTSEETKISDHATTVTTILYKIAPEAEYYFNLIADTISLEWFIDNGCDVVNCSWGFTGAKINDEGIYEAPTSNVYKMDKDGLYDYQVQNHFITVVKSAGNVSTNNSTSSYNPNGLITNPGYAYNVITVGGIYKDGTEIVHHPNAAFVSGNVIKPNVSAPYVVDVPGIGINRGTSIAAPQVTASIALLYDKQPRLASYPEITMAIITSSATETDDYDLDDKFIDEMVGTGYINIDDMINIASAKNYDKESNENWDKNEIFNIDIELSHGDVLQVSSAWIVRISTDGSGNPSEIDLTDYDMTLKDPSGASIEISNFGDDSNLEFIKYKVKEDGIYTVIVNMYSGFEYGDNDIDWLAISYCIK